MRILVCGDRNWVNKERIREVLSKYNIDIIIEGKAKGADTLAGELADELITELWEFPANWNRYGKSAGIVRNQRMLTGGNPDLIIAFHNNISESKGTKDMVNRAFKQGYDVVIVTETKSYVMEDYIK